MTKNDFSEQLKMKMDEYAHLIYKLTRNFPKEELYAIISQLRRAFLSVILNYIEGFARMQKAIKRNFWEISYGSLQESKYLLDFSLKQNYIIRKDYEIAIKLADEIGAMLWRSIQSLK